MVLPKQEGCTSAGTEPPRLWNVFLPCEGIGLHPTQLNQAASQANLAPIRSALYWVLHSPYSPLLQGECGWEGLAGLWIWKRRNMLVLLELLELEQQAGHCQCIVSKKLEWHFQGPNEERLHGDLVVKWTWGFTQRKERCIYRCRACVNGESWLVSLKAIDLASENPPGAFCGVALTRMISFGLVNASKCEKLIYPKECASCPHQTI